MNDYTLKTGDTVSFVATARKISHEEIMPAIKIFEQWGLKVIIPSTLFEIENQFAGADKIRATTFEEAWNNEEVKALFCIRGGYGTIRIVDKLKLTRKGNPPLLIGYSDVTVLLNHLWQNHSIKTYHAPMAINMLPEKINKTSIEFLRHCLFDGPQPISFKKHNLNFGQFPKEAFPILGGNLSVLYSMLGSNSFPNLANCYLFLEDLDEYLYHIDRMMQGLKRAGVLNGVKGLIVGNMSDMKDNAIPFGSSAEEIILATAIALNLPVAFGLPAGHEPLNLALLIGNKYQVVEDSNGISLLPELDSLN